MTPLIGPAARVRAVLLRKIERLLAGDFTQKESFLLWGPRGTGKTTIASELSLIWAGHPICVETLNGQDLTVDRIRDWEGMVRGQPLHGTFLIKLIDEIDQGSPAALGKMRTFLNVQHMPKYIGVLATTNKTPQQLPGAVQSRFYDREVAAPSRAEIIGHLIDAGAPDTVAVNIVEHSEGDVRQSLIDYRKWLDENETTQVQSSRVQRAQVRRTLRVQAAA